jgi:hypothetical protein
MALWQYDQPAWAWVKAWVLLEKLDINLIYELFEPRQKARAKETK